MMESFAIPCPPFNLVLSHWDRRLWTVYSKRLLCFPISNNDKEHQKTITKFLLEAFKATVEELPFLAGSVVPFSKEQPWLHDIRPQGAAHLEVQDLTQELNFNDLRKASFTPSLLDADQLLPLPALAYIQDDPIDVCRFRANFMDGGLILAVQFVHTVFDGVGITEVLKIFASNLVKAQAGELKASRSIENGEDASKPVYSFDRNSVLSGNGAHGDIENHPGYTVAPATRYDHFFGKVIITNFHISKDSLRALKLAVSSKSNSTSDQVTVPNPSTHDAVVALIWRSLMLARQRAGIIPSNGTVNFSMSVNCRRVLDLPKPYFGNAIYGLKMSLPLSDLAPVAGLQTAARLLRQNITATTAETFRDILGFAERTTMEKLTRLSVMEDLSEGSVLLTSWFGFEMYTMNFGEVFGEGERKGKIESFRLPARGLVPGMPIVLPRLADGGCEFVVSEREDVMGFLGEDELFGRFARRQ